MKKKIVLGLTAMVIVAAMAIGGTLAFMTQKTATMTNTFTAAKGLSGEMREPAWDGYEFGQTNGNEQPDGSVAKTGIEGDALAKLGITKANAMTPGLDIPKNPMLKNTSAVPVYMAIKVTYGTKEKFDKIAQLDIINAGWVESSTSGIYLYADKDGMLKKVDKDTETTALFNKITINSDVTTDLLTNNAFTITVTGGAVQTTDINNATATNQLINLLK
jgi:predicted ribosomally synthesized peptide with SipW-like signal peptide